MTTPLDITDFVYNTGTLTIAPGDTTAVFSGTSLSANIKDGDTLCAVGVEAPIQTVTDDTHVELFLPWPGSAVSADIYVIKKDSMLRNNAVQIGYDTAAFLAFLDNTTIWYVVDGDSPDPSVGEDGNRALNTNVSPWKQWLKTGGVWVEQAGSPGGQGDPGADGATWIAQASEPSTDYPVGSLWIDSDSADLDVYQLGGSPLAWEDTGINLKGAAGAAGLGVPDGGATGQVLAKVSASDNDTEWIDPPETGDVAGETHAATGKTTPADADELPLVDSAASNALKKLTWANLKAALGSTFLTWAPVRERLTANRTYYVDGTNGSDSNDGLASGSGHAFATIQKAIDVACGLDLSICNVTIQLAAGTYTGANTLKTYLGVGPITVLGDASTPSNVTVSTGSSHAFRAAGVLGSWTLNGLKIQTTNGHGIYASDGSRVNFQSIEFGSVSAGSHILSIGTGTTVTASGGYKISGGASRHWWAENGALITAAAKTITLSGTPAFTGAFAFTQTAAILQVNGNTYSGTGATGKIYDASLNAVVYAGGTTLPGNTTGTTTTGAQFL